MLAEPSCFTRRCRHLQGVVYLDEELGEESEVVVCPAYPEGIPFEITSGEDLHQAVRPDQVGTVVYEREEVPYRLTSERNAGARSDRAVSDGDRRPGGRADGRAERCRGRDAVGEGVTTAVVNRARRSGSFRDLGETYRPTGRCREPADVGFFLRILEPAVGLEPTTC